MTADIGLVLIILAVAIILFVTEWLRADLVALLVLSALALSGLVSPTEALSGFSSPAVVTVWAVFILSAGLSSTGVANTAGRQILRLAGQSQARLTAVIMLTAGVLSAFMNNIGVAALLLPVVLDLARRTGFSRARLLMPLAYGALLGGLTTLIGTPPNILASDALREAGVEPFRFFDFTSVGGPVLLAGVAYMLLLGQRLLPAQDVVREARAADPALLAQLYHLPERLFVVALAEQSALAGKSVAQSRLGEALGLVVLGVLRDHETFLAPEPDFVLRGGDRLIINGRTDQIAALRDRRQLAITEASFAVEDLLSAEIGLAEVGLSPRSTLLGQTLAEIEFRQKYGCLVLAIWRDGRPLRSNLGALRLQLGDTLLIQGSRRQLDALRELPDFLVAATESIEIYRLHERLLAIPVTSDSALAGHTLAESQLAAAFGLTLLGIVREGRLKLMATADERFQIGDRLLVMGRSEQVTAAQQWGELELEAEGMPSQLDFEPAEQAVLAEAILAPHTTVAGQNLRQMRFRERFGLNVLAIWRGDRAFYDDLSQQALRLGDALLLYGPRRKLELLAENPDFVVLTEEISVAARPERARLALLIMGAVVVTVSVGWLPIAVAAIAGSVAMILTGCLTIEDAYRQINWPAVFLIAGMLPLGVALEKSGAASLLAGAVVNTAGGYGLLMLMAGLFVLTNLASQFMPNAVATLLMAPIAINTAAEMAVSPRTFMMIVALAASASFMSPVSHAANVLVMGPGGYRFRDYVRAGLPLTLLVMLLALLLVPRFWPL